jgi:hypothetical protein
MFTDAILTAMGFALAGWFATLIVISGSRMRALWKQLLLVPSWIPWAGLALGAPVVRGSLDISGALGIAGAMTLGMLVSIVAAQLRQR